MYLDIIGFLLLGAINLFYIMRMLSIIVIDVVEEILNTYYNKIKKIFN